MNKLICYIHFLGFVPAMVTYVNANPEREIGSLEALMSAIFSWGFVFGQLIERT
ncbi:hypothetical protein NVP1016O_24 [Vibrio phage 1.016.O._10N.286.46.A11]|nr:hypothetical protein NVP1016O_24 [Vibrio phage 1.016.O._10N.286.46.A11]AUR85253.1 hypothetical protein NVP1071A_23 [Vibrio phage 1.071.A._10N.286.46.A12]